MACSYNVLEYAWEPHEAYTRQYGGGRALGRALVVGMNPGPWGMVRGKWLLMWPHFSKLPKTRSEIGVVMRHEVMFTLPFLSTYKGVTLSG